VLNVILKKSSMSIISPICSQLNPLKMAIRTAHHRLILKVEKPREVPI
jgi:hypothetical protein